LISEGKMKTTSKENRKIRVRRKIRQNRDRFRLSVFRSSKHIYAQIINDVDSVTMVSASTKSKEIKLDKTSDVNAATQVGKLIAEKAKAAKIEKVSLIVVAICIMVESKHWLKQHVKPVCNFNKEYEEYICQ